MADCFDLYFSWPCGHKEELPNRTRCPLKDNPVLANHVLRMVDLGSDGRSCPLCPQREPAPNPIDALQRRLDEMAQDPAFNQQRAVAAAHEVPVPVVDPWRREDPSAPLATLMAHWIRVGREVWNRLPGRPYIPEFVDRLQAQPEPAPVEQPKGFRFNPNTAFRAEFTPGAAGWSSTQLSRRAAARNRAHYFHQPVQRSTRGSQSTHRSGPSTSAPPPPFMPRHELRQLQQQQQQQQQQPTRLRAVISAEDVEDNTEAGPTNEGGRQD